MIKITHKKYPSIEITGLGKFDNYKLQFPKEQIGSAILPETLLNLIERDQISVTKKDLAYINSFVEGVPEGLKIVKLLEKSNEKKKEENAKRREEEAVKVEKKEEKKASESKKGSDIPKHKSKK